MNMKTNTNVNRDADDDVPTPKDVTGGSGSTSCSLVEFFLWVTPIIEREIDPLEYTSDDIQRIIAETLIHMYNQWAKGKCCQIDDVPTDEELCDRLGIDSVYVG